ncbi:MAG: helix-turn-helix domain-containing protein [Propionibacteriaceae bacterium]|nr:helix-turn-helix domain-containing protein [Propionibacteriaceae bacterium]
MTEKIYYTPYEAAEETGLNVNEIRALCRAGELGAFKGPHSSLWHIPAVGLMAWMEKAQKEWSER